VISVKKVFFGFLLVLTYKMPVTKLRPTSTMKSKDKSSKQRFGHVNATNPNSYLNIIFITASPGVHCPSVCPSVTLMYCIQTAKDIVKLLSRPGSTICLLLFDPETTQDRAIVTIEHQLNPVFKVTAFLSRISQKRCILGTKLL